MDRWRVRHALLRLVAPWIALVSMGLFAEARADPSAELEKAHSAYVAHKYADAEVRLRALLDPKTGTPGDPDAVADARMYLGAVLVAEQRREEADAVFLQLLNDRPDYQPDPLRVSLQAINALIDARTAHRERFAALEADRVRKAQEAKARVEAERQRAASRLAMLERLAGEEVVVERHSRWMATIPFGVGQFQNGQIALGATLLAGESVLGAGAVVGAILTLYNYGQVNRALVRGDGTALGYQTRLFLAADVGDAFAGAFALAAIGGVIHAQLTFVRDRVEIHKRTIPPLSLVPFVGPGVVGFGGTF
ncbi:MAG: hypothetical protein ABSC94_07410 [Polyangiaceae bacterium]